MGVFDTPIDDVLEKMGWRRHMDPRRMTERGWLSRLIFFGGLECRPDKPHRLPSNSCKLVHEKVMSCYLESKCMKTMDRTFTSCFNNADENEVGSDCLSLKSAYHRCRGSAFGPHNSFRGE
eukprot:GHVN01040790.1.p1 GENE.GHVN01040790.1~~GHVN01040790.1.p1  ORF type:complete len:121 (+),score=25.78 GHVN01040790.1:104-466(+)